MPRHPVATFLLRQLLPRASADALLGDLAETCGTHTPQYRGLLRQSVWSLLWRFGTTFLTAAASGLACLIAALATVSFTAGISPAHWPRLFSLALLLAMPCLTITAVFYAVRHGVRDRAAANAMALGAATFLSLALSWTQPFSAAAILSLAIGLIAWHNRSHLRAFASVISLALAQPLLWLLFLASGSQAEVHFIFQHGRLGKLLFLSTASCTFLVIALLCCIGSAAAHRWSQRAATAS